MENVEADMKDKLFRKAALEKLSSPEQLDQIIKITKPGIWVLLVIIALLLCGFVFWGFAAVLPVKVSASGILISSSALKNIISTEVGQLVDLYVKIGESVAEGQVVARIAVPYSPVKHPVTASTSGKIIEVRVTEGSLIDKGTILFSIETGNQDDIQAFFYFPPTLGKSIVPGMKVQIEPSTVSREEYGVMIGTVLHVGQFPASFQGMMTVLGNEELVSTFMSNGAPIKVTVDLQRSRTTVSGFEWTSPQGPGVRIDNGTICDGWITTKEVRPVDLVFPVF